MNKLSNSIPYCQPWATGMQVKSTLKVSKWRFPDISWHPVPLFNHFPSQDNLPNIKQVLTDLSPFLFQSLRRQKT